MKTIYSTALIALASLLITGIANADQRCHDGGYHTNSWSQRPLHQGEVDSDGILSAGEIRNPLINYESAYRRAERYDDERFDNPYNRDAARDERAYYEHQRHDFHHSTWRYPRYR